MRRLLPGLIVLLALPPSAHAHDFWLEPSGFVLPLGAPLSVALRVGEEFFGQPISRAPAAIERFELASADGRRQPLHGRTGDDPAGIVGTTRSGVEVVGYRSRSHFVGLKADEFERYLREEGLEAIIAERQARGERARPARELFSRSAKALVRIGQGGASAHDRRLGYTLELVAEQDPYRLRAGATFSVRLFHRDQPLARALIFARARDNPRQAQTVRSDTQGRARFRLDRPGIWLIKATHMVRTSGVDARRAEWQSVWASLTFELPR